jgi:hypothetical protein
MFRRSSPFVLRAYGVPSLPTSRALPLFEAERARRVTTGMRLDNPGIALLRHLGCLRSEPRLLARIMQ